MNTKYIIRTSNASPIASIRGKFIFTTSHACNGCCAQCAAVKFLCVHLHDIAVAARLILEKGENRMLIAAILQTHTVTHHTHEYSF